MSNDLVFLTNKISLARNYSKTLSTALTNASRLWRNGKYTDAYNLLVRSLDNAKNIYAQFNGSNEDLERLDRLMLDAYSSRVIGFPKGRFSLGDGLKFPGSISHFNRQVQNLNSLAENSVNPTMFIQYTWNALTAGFDNAINSATNVTALLDVIAKSVRQKGR